jgi:hypothetical protein
MGSQKPQIPNSWGAQDIIFATYNLHTPSPRLFFPLALSSSPSTKKKKEREREKETNKCIKEKPNSKYFQLCGPHRLCQHYSALAIWC